MIALTGATGQLGRLIIDSLLDRIAPDELIALTRSTEKAADLAQKGVALRLGDYENIDSLMAAFVGVRTLMFISNSDVMRRAQQHKNVVDAAVGADIERIVYTSFIQTGSKDPLTQSHADTEASIKSSGIPHIFLRDNFYMDMYVGEVNVAIEQGTYRTARGSDTGAALVTRSDIARTAAVVLTEDGHEGKTYEMTGPASVTPAIIAATATAIAGKPIAQEQISFDELAEEYKQRGMPEPMVQLSVMLERMIGTNALAGVSDDIERITGKAPVDFLTFVKEMMAK